MNQCTTSSFHVVSFDHAKDSNVCVTQSQKHCQKSTLILFQIVMVLLCSKLKMNYYVGEAALKWWKQDDIDHLIFYNYTF